MTSSIHFCMNFCQGERVWVAKIKASSNPNNITVNILTCSALAKTSAPSGPISLNIRLTSCRTGLSWNRWPWDCCGTDKEGIWWQLRDNWAISWDYGTFRPPQTHSSNAHAQPSSGARCLIFGRTLHLLPYFMCANSAGSGETVRMRRLAWALAGRLCDKYHNRMSWLNYAYFSIKHRLWVLIRIALARRF